MIVFSILLALSLESCREHRRERHLSETALHAIQAELESNKQAIAASLPLQRSQLGSLREAANATGQRPLHLTSGMAPPVLMSSAFETATTTGALGTADFETVLVISRAYASQRWMARVEDGWIRVVSSPGAWEKRNARLTASLLLGILTEYVTVETRLDAAYDEVINRLRAHEPSASTAGAPHRL